VPPTERARSPENQERSFYHHPTLHWLGRRILHLTTTVHGLGAFGLITLGVALTKSGQARRLIFPLVWQQIYRAGVQLLPIITFLSLALGLLVIGQTVSLLTRVGATQWVGVIMVMVVVRELGPLVTALLVLARAGTAIVIELGTARALGEVEALEALGIDPIHYLVLPRVVGLAIAILSLTIYLILLTLGSGYLFAFLQDVPIMPGEYFSQLARSLQLHDFALLALKTVSFGVVIAVVTCYYGLARPLYLEEVSQVTTRALVNSVILCILLDALFLLVYLTV
jgi:phospholipid/cholesterol/gamma-HCH transport system permease protein